VAALEATPGRGPDRTVSRGATTRDFNMADQSKKFNTVPLNRKEVWYTTCPSVRWKPRG